MCIQLHIFSLILKHVHLLNIYAHDIRIIYFTVVLCVYLIVPHKQLFRNLFTLHLQIKDGNMYAYVHSWLPHDGDRNQQNNQLLNPFLCNIFLYWLAIPFIDIIFY